jgi:hypothetical protein
MRNRRTANDDMDGLQEEVFIANFKEITHIYLLVGYRVKVEL